MAKKVTHAVLDGPSPFVTNRERLARIYGKLQFVKSENTRSRVAEGPGIFITTSGMLQGGPAIHYLEHMWSDNKSAVLLTGYQVKGTNGWMVDNEHTAYLGGYRTKIQCEVHRYDFSGHLSNEDIKATILAVQPKILIFNHGNREATTAMAEWAKVNVHCEILTPEIGEEATIDDTGTVMKKLYDECIGPDCILEHQHGEGHHPEGENDD
jgi:putative mRNA 3-end processing factor